ncbi:ABC transporter permease [Arachnia propionica]|uniref:ABC transporter permease n=1 Tax=Arachnia propionica TaxID=1750 RepID=A0A3P1TCC9_9ACTN|nr:ABC transporter permease [Arachnia propionica]MDO5082548.1 ABC transporter permease [Arachnia propionica]RRD07044.1 ABC transporter permease [Arachnia propionica]
MNPHAVARRIIGLVVSLLVASVLIFLATNALPGSVAGILLGTQASPEEVAALETRLGLDRPLVIRYLEWISGVVVGDFGTSMISGQEVMSQILPRLGISVWLIVSGMLIALVVAIPLGTHAALRRRHLSGFLSSMLSQVGLAVPAFWAAMWLVIVFAVHLRWFPAGGYVPLTQDPARWASHLALPALSLGLVQGSLLSRYVRSAVIEVTGEDWFRTARSVGWSRWGALLRHGSRNVAISLLTVLGLQIATLLVGAIIIEQVFSIQGLGSRLLRAVSQRDLVLVQGIVLILVWTVLVINFVVDAIYHVVDPRLRNTREAR